MLAPEHEDKCKFRHIPMERQMSVRSNDAVDSHQMLEAILRQEASFLRFAEEQASWRADMQTLLGQLSHYMDKHQSRLHRSTSSHSHHSEHSNLSHRQGHSPDGSCHAAVSLDHKMPSVTTMDATMATAKQIKKDRNMKKKLFGLGTAEEFTEKLAMHTKSPFFEYAISGVIVVNVVCTSIHLQWQGYASGNLLGLRSDDAGWSSAETGFEIIERVFCGVFALELLLRMWAFGWSFFHSVFNWLDGSIVLFTCVDTFILRAMARTGGMNLSSLRVMRAFRVFRVIKVVRFADHMREMRVLIRTLIASWRSVGWSMFLVMAVTFAAAITICALSHPFMDDDSIGLDERRQLYELFGTTTRSFQTMFESTFTGAWRIYTRLVFKEISPLFAIFWIPYVACINFALLRVIAAIFMKNTIVIAEQDTERLAMEKMKAKEKFASELREMFVDADASGDGAISKDEFDGMIRLPSVVTRFAKLDLELDEVVALYGVLSADDGSTDYEEFLHAALKMKSSARTIDTIQILHQQLETHKAVADLREAFSSFTRKSAQHTKNSS